MRFIYFWFLFLAVLFLSCSGLTENVKDLQSEFKDPPREFSLMPFWFWNDTLRDDELIRQITDFEAHGVYGFVIHPRIGLPEDTGWLSPAMIHAKNIAIKEAAKRDMYVILYDEGMYPSGSSAGQVVARNPDHAARGLAKIDLEPVEEPRLAEDMKLVTVIERPGGDRVAIVEKPSGGVIRGLHYIDEGTERVREHLPPAADILNPDAVESFIELVYERFAKEFGEYFGTTIIGIFTDEPDMLGRGSKRGMMAGNADLMNQVNNILGNSTYLPYRAAKACFQNQRDFNYLETKHLWEDSEVDNNGVRLAGMHYKAVILDSLIYLQDEAIPALRELERSGRLIIWNSSPHAETFNNARKVASSGELVGAIDELVTPDLILDPTSSNIRYRHLIKGDNHYFILFNEEDSAVNTRIDLSVTGESWWLDPASGEATRASLDESVSFDPFELKLLMVKE